MKPRTLSQLAAELGLRADDDAGATLTSVSTDSRAVEPGELFVAIQGETYDGNCLIDKAIAVRIIDIGTVRPINKEGIGTHRAAGSHRAINATGNNGRSLFI